MRRETFLGRVFRVVPAVLVRSQVLHNNLGAAFLPPEEITPEWARAWNGIPVLIGPHPTDRGQPVSGRTPQLWDARVGGWLFNAQAESNGTVRRLTAEVWLDESRAEAVDGLTAVLARLDAGEPVELSTGFDSFIETTNGTADGEPYSLVMRPHGADHLAIFPDVTVGACSVRDGCGLGVNAEHAHGRMTMADKSARTPEPAPDAGTPKVGERLAAILARVGAMFVPAVNEVAEAWDKNVSLTLARELTALNAVQPSDQERMNWLRSALQAKFGASDREVVVTDVYSDARQVVFWMQTPAGPNPPGAEFFRTTFEEGEAGAFTFAEPERVRRMTSYEAVTPRAMNSAPASSTASARPCGCQHTQEVVMQENEKQEIVTAVTAAMNGQLASALDAALKPMGEKLEAINASATEAAVAAANAAIEPVKAQLEALTAKVEAVATAANAEREAERQALVTELSANGRTPFSAAELEAKPVDELRKLAVLAKVDVTSFAGRGAPRAVTHAKSDEPAFAEPVPYYAQKTAKQAGE